MYLPYSPYLPGERAPLMLPFAKWVKLILSDGKALKMVPGGAINFSSVLCELKKLTYLCSIKVKAGMSNKIDLRKGQIELIEKLAVIFEKGGLQPAMAKIIGLLMVNDEPEMTFDEIWETLGISKSATSQALNQLLNVNKVEFKTKLGDRKRYFCSRVTSWQEDIKGNMESLSFLTNVLKQVLDQRPKRTTEINASLKKLIAFLDFLIKELPELYKKFESHQQ